LEGQVPLSSRERDTFKGCGSSHTNLQHECLSIAGWFLQGVEQYDDKVLVGAYVKLLKNILDEPGENGKCKVGWRIGL
jgi:hypothetical protein